jgi:hypothetical protein
MRWFVVCVFLAVCLSAWPISPGELTELKAISLDFEVASSVLSPALAQLILALAQSTKDTLALQLDLAEARKLFEESQRDLSEARQQLGIWRMELDSSAQLIIGLQTSFSDYRADSEKLRRRTAVTWAIGGVVVGAGVSLAIIGLVKLL